MAMAAASAQLMLANGGEHRERDSDLEADESSTLRPVEEALGASRPRRLRWRLAAGGALLAVAALAAGGRLRAGAWLGLAATEGARSSTSVRVIGLSGVEAFGQCGGKDFGSEDCEEGCACIAKTVYFHQCQTPEGSNDCDADAAGPNAKKLVKKARALIAELRHAEDEKEAATIAKKEAEQHLAKVKKELAEVRANKEKAATSAAYKGAAVELAKEKLKKASEAAAVASNHSMTATQHAEGMQSAIKVWKMATDPEMPAKAGKGVVGMFKQCGGQGFKVKPCQQGCACLWQTDYYSQCGPPGDAGACDVQAAMGQVAKMKVGARTAKARSEAAARENEKATQAAAKASAAVREAEAANRKVIKDNTELPKLAKAKAAEFEKAKSTLSHAKKTLAAMRKAAAAVRPKALNASKLAAPWAKAAGLDFTPMGDEAEEGEEEEEDGDEEVDMAEK